MTSASKRKGSQAERDVVTYLQSVGWPYAERRLAGSTTDRGDIAGVGAGAVCIEVKNHSRLALGDWIDQVEVETVHARANVGVCIHKRRGKTSVGDWYATLPVHMLVTLLKEAGYQ